MWSTEELHFHYYEMDGAPWLPEFEETSMLLQRRGEFSSDQRWWDPSAHVSQWTTPELVIHGEKDYRVPISESLALFNVLQARGVPSRCWIGSTSTWVFRRSKNKTWMMQIPRAGILEEGLRVGDKHLMVHWWFVQATMYGTSTISECVLAIRASAALISSRSITLVVDSFLRPCGVETI
jgi:hypothetical protein